MTAILIQYHQFGLTFVDLGVNAAAAPALNTKAIATKSSSMKISFLLLSLSFSPAEECINNTNSGEISTIAQ